MILQFIWHYNVIIHKHTCKNKQQKNNLTIYYKTKKYQSQVQLNVLSHKNHCLQVVFVFSTTNLLPSLSSSQSSRASRTHFCKKGKGLVNCIYNLLPDPSFPFLLEWVWLARLVSILSSLGAVYLFSLFSTDSHNHPRITATDHQHYIKFGLGAQ